MHRSRSLTRLALAMFAGTLALAAAAPDADAGHRHGRKWKRGCSAPHVHHVHYAPRIYKSEACGLPAFAGFVGGLIVGAAVSTAHAEPAPVYSYYDPYCDRSWSSLDACAPHFRHSGHPRVVRVIDVRTGHCVDRWTWYRGNWHDDDD
jgi:hypothetical protein